MELLHKKIFERLLEPDLDFFFFSDFLNIKLGGGKIPWPGYVHLQYS